MHLNAYFCAGKCYKQFPIYFIKMKKLVLLLAASIYSAAWLSAQDVRGTCGVSTDDQRQYEDRLIANIEKANSGQVASDRGAIQYVPIHFHLVGDGSGNGKLRENKVLDQLCALNAAYAPLDVRFYLSEHPTLGTLFDYTINSTNVYSNQTAWLTMQNKRNANALNVYIVDEAESGNGQPGTTLAYYNPPRDWVVSRKDQINGSAANSTIPHEIGHFFSLDHTFYGWESASFAPGYPGWPIAPALSPGGVPTEKQDGSNCTTAADRICDTPPDYNFGFVDNDCVYTGGAKDPIGVLVDPIENNMMSYFLQCATHTFTPDQMSTMLADLASPARNYLDNSFSPAATEINTPTDLLTSPASNETTQYFDDILFEWQQVPGATYYLLEIDIVSSFVTPNMQAFIVNSNSKLVTTLLANRTYYWRVRPFNEYVTCASSRQASFKTPAISAVNDIAGLNAWSVAPNPVRNGAANLVVQAENGFDANLQVLDATGRQMYAQNGLNFPTGESRVELPVSSLQNGLYFVVLQSQGGQSVRKISVLR